MPKVLISYRRDDSSPMSGRIRDRLVLFYGKDDVCQDVESFPLGQDFRTYVLSQIRASDIVLAIVGARWRGQANDGTARLDASDDPVRIEIEAALSAQRTLIPVLIEGTKMPRPDEVPESISHFCYLNAAEIRSGTDFNLQVEHLIERLETLKKPGIATRLRSLARLDRINRPSRSRIAATLGLAAAAGLALAATLWGDRVSPPERQAAVFLLPPSGFDGGAETRATFLKLWGPFYDGMKKGSTLRTIPDDREIGDESEFIALFTGNEAYSDTAMDARIAEYEQRNRSRVEWLLRPTIEPQDDRVRVTLDLATRQDDRFTPNTRLADQIGRADFVAVAAGYQAVKSILPATPEAERAVAEVFERRLRNSMPGIGPRPADAQPCVDFGCVDELIVRLSSDVSERSDTTSLLATAVVSARLAAGAARP